MIHVLLVTHGGLAEELLAAARTISGELPGFRALTLDWKDGLEAARQRIAGEIAALPAGAEIIILTDMYGSTPTNAALDLAEAGRIEVISGVNLPMVVRLACSSAPGMPVTDVARWLEIKGRRSISRARPPEEPAGSGSGSDGS
ncbi:MAG: PTS sugar transporter subunit IIA [Thermoanaerobaculia bacterium]